MKSVVRAAWYVVRAILAAERELISGLDVPRRTYYVPPSSTSQAAPLTPLESPHRF